MHESNSSSPVTHPQGRVVLLTTTKEHAEFKQEQVHAFGPDRRIKECAGAMSCIIEPAPAS